MDDQISEWAWLDARETVTVAELARACGLSANELEELVEYGALPPLQATQSEHVFSAEWVMPLRTAGRLRADYDLDLFAVGMLLGYLNRIDELERRLQALQAQLPGRNDPAS